MVSEITALKERIGNIERSLCRFSEMLKSEADVEITDLEIEQVESEQSTTDLEIEQVETSIALTDAEIAIEELKAAAGT